MVRILNKIKDPGEDLKALNTNFDRLSLDIAARSGAFSSNAFVGPITLNSGESATVQVSVIDIRNDYVINLLPVVPRVTMYIGLDNDDNFLWPGGPQLVDNQRYDILMTVHQNQSVFSEVDNEKATYFIHVKNIGPTDPYSVYIHTDCFYVPAPDEGVANRGTT